MRCPWPYHWYTGGDIRCVVFGCEFVTPAAAAIDQLADLEKHFGSVRNFEHTVMVHMLCQLWCVHCGHFSGNPARPLTMQSLFHHEVVAHSDTSMSRIEQFVTLARNGRVRARNPDAIHMAIFGRMLDNIELMGDTVFLMFLRAGYVNPAHQTRNNLIQIVSQRTLRPEPPQDKYWTPLPAAQFLMNVAPGVNEPANGVWRVQWTCLRIMYAQGII